jgi:hypothetical protein
MADYTGQIAWQDETGVGNGTLVAAGHMNAMEAALADASAHHKKGLWANIPAANAASKNWTYWCTDRGVLYGNFDGATWTRLLGDAPLGAVTDWLGANPPPGWATADSSQQSRATYADLFAALTFTGNGSTTIGSNVISNVLQDSKLLPGVFVEGPGVPAGTRIRSVSAPAGGFVDITLSNNATSTNAGVSYRFGRWGFGDGSTTFNLPLLTNVGCRLTSSSATATGNVIPWNGTEIYDPAGMHDPANASRVNALVSGKYEVNVQAALNVVLPSNLSGEVYMTLLRTRNGVTDPIADSNFPPMASSTNFPETLDLIAGDYIEVKFTNGSATAATITGAERSVHLECHLLGGSGPVPKIIKLV